MYGKRMKRALEKEKRVCYTEKMFKGIKKWEAR